jgi:hypothetical protein
VWHNVDKGGLAASQGNAMELVKDDRVRMPAKPEWGLGHVIQNPAGGKVFVLFREAGEKTLSLKHAKLVSVEGEEASDPWLDNLNFDVSALGSRYLGPREAVAVFLEKYPGGFQEKAYIEEERAPKVAAHELIVKLLDRDVINGLLEAGEFDKVGSAALRVIGKTNLVYPSDRLALTRALKVDGNAERFARALQDQLYGAGDPATRFKRFADALAELDAARWTLCTYFSFIRFPEEYMLLKPTLTQNAAARCRFDLDYRAEPNRITYGRLLAFVRILSDVIAELRPADMFDVQAFMWCLASIKD